MDQRISKPQEPKTDTLYLETFFSTCVYYFDHPTAEETNRKLKSKKLVFFFKTEGLLKTLKNEKIIKQIKIMFSTADGIWMFFLMSHKKGLEKALIIPKGILFWLARKIKFGQISESTRNMASGFQRERNFFIKK